jgi:hypothetical protein
MEHRGVEYGIVQGIQRGFWKWSVETGTEPPVFKVRKSTTGFTWVVEIIWGGQTEAIDGFASEKAAIDWIAKVREILAKEK